MKSNAETVYPVNKAPIEYIEYYVYVGMSSKMYTMYSYEKGNYNYSQIAF